MSSPADESAAIANPWKAHVVVEAICCECKTVQTKKVRAERADSATITHVCHTCKGVTYWNIRHRVSGGGDE